MRYGLRAERRGLVAERAAQRHRQILLVGSVEAALLGRQVEPAAELGHHVPHRGRRQRGEQAPLGVHARGDDDRDRGIELRDLTYQGQWVRRRIDVEIEHHDLELARPRLGHLLRRQRVVDADADGAERLGDAADGRRMAGDHGAAPVLGQVRIRRQEGHSLIVAEFSSLVGRFLATMENLMADDPNGSAKSPPAADTKPCPLCGEEIKKVAVRCKHCQADLTKPVDADADFKGTEPAAPKPMDDFEVRFLEFAYQTTTTINVPAVAHALRLPTAVVSDKLEDMAARDVIVRDVDDEGNVFFTIPGRATARTPANPPLGPRRRARAAGGHQPALRRDGRDRARPQHHHPRGRLAHRGTHVARRAAAGAVGRELAAHVRAHRLSDAARRVDLVAGKRDPNSGRVQTTPNFLVNRAFAT